MQALKEQLIYELKRFKAKENSIETLFIGGATPSTISPKLFKPIFELLYPYLQKNSEITSEANPNSATYEWLEGMYRLGVNRISFGVQSFDEKKLKILNRAHTPKMAIEALQNAQKIGYKNLSLDLIYATLGDTKELLEYDIKTAFSLPINHISAYALTIEEGTAFESKKEMSNEQLSLTEWLFETIKKYGFKQYEISNFGSYKSSHNMGYWLYKDYIGVGAGAVAKLGTKRYYSEQSIESYILSPTALSVESLAQEDIKLEKIFLGLRSMVGVDKTLLDTNQQKAAQKLFDEGMLYREGGRIYNKNFLLADEIALYLDSY